MIKKYFFDQDNDCHWYKVELDHKDDWLKWLNLDEDDEASWNVPEYAKIINGVFSEEFYSVDEVDREYGILPKA